MASYRIAKSLDQLRSLVNSRSPNRNKASDGWIGDARHCGGKNPTSDHCAKAGVVRALDVTHDPANGCDAGAIARAIAVSNDPRLGYIIWNRQIYNPKIAKTWRAYSGKNPHTKHVHVSAHNNVDSTALWAIDAAFGAKPPAVVVKPLDPALSKPFLKQGSKGAGVKELQRLLNAHMAG